MQAASIAGSPPGPAAGAGAAADASACASAAGEALAAARGLLHQLRTSQAETTAAAEAHRREREGLMHQLQAIQSRYAGLLDFIWQLDTTQLDAEGLEAASDAAAAAAEAAALTNSALGGFSDFASASEEAALAASQHDVALLFMEMQRTQQERDALLYRLDQLEQHIREQQQAQQAEDQQQGFAAAASTHGAGASPGVSVGSSGSSPTHVAQITPPNRVPSRRRQPATAGERVLASLQDLSSLIDDATATGGLASGAASQLWQQCAELQAQVHGLCDQAAASAAAADQLQQLLAAERAERGDLQQRLAGAQRRQRAARQKQSLLRQHVGELEELVHAAIGEAEGAQELLEKVTAEGAGGKLKLGEVWTQLLESQQRASAALRSPPSAATAAAVPDAQSAVAAWQLLEEATGGAPLPSPSRQASSGLRDRLAALSRRYSSTTLEQAEAAAAVEAAAEGAAGGQEAGPADVVEAAEEEAEASLMAAAAVAAGWTELAAATPPRSAGSTQAGDETPSRLGSVSSSLARSPAAAPQEPAVGGSSAVQPDDVAERMDAILADLQQRLGSLEAAAAATAAAPIRALCTYGLTLLLLLGSRLIVQPAAAAAAAASSTAACTLQLALQLALLPVLLLGGPKLAAAGRY
ncbi:hypothetical protein C2E21_2017 [Chlorella sorokiniana]|uniref:Uncharacterized protein n=1 Tax=Chlorella sorokiniana TaxID=3076 RepID=A0A2P6TZQ9_CHLSO|nr:hypothetical protein C2E21_2017 [Chlorella sorokiniana]|eukprot:PRW59547.1 hypothetical protein C2E21_2017 [Chlorella sorokiniana]